MHMAVIRTPKKIILSNLNTEKIISIALISIFIILLVISALLYNFIGLSWENLVIHSLMISVFILFFYTMNKISQVSILGDSVIVKMPNSRRIVAPIQSIKKVKQYSLFNYKIYSLEFKLDGKYQKVNFLSATDKNTDIQLLTSHKRMRAA